MTLLDQWTKLDVEASNRKENTYIDPQTGYRVFSSYGLLKRKDCCGCGCRHCPFGHQKVPPSKRHTLPQNPWIEENTIQPPIADCDVVSWSGGKDSYLALLSLQKENKRPIVLMNTFDGRSKKVAHQELSLTTIRLQAQALGLSLLLIPLYPEIGYTARISQGLSLLSQSRKIHRLAFGDLHLQHVREWREKEFRPILQQHDIAFHFPLWKQSYDKLLTQLIASPAKCHISAIANEECQSQISVGEPFDSQLIQKLPDKIDAFGENGEFHTCISL